VSRDSRLNAQHSGRDGDHIDGTGARRTRKFGAFDEGEHRLRLRARIILLASDGAATRQIARTVGCTIGTASKWRVRYAAKRIAGLDDTGERGAEPKYGPEHNARILALLDQSRLLATPTGLGRC